MRHYLAIGLASLCLLAGLAPAQTALTTTTLSSAATVDETVVVVASATGISAPTLVPRTALVIDGEMMRVKEVNSTRITVERGVGTARTAHASGAKVWIGPPEAFAKTAPTPGPCTAADQPYHPTIVLGGAGEIWSCDGYWQRFRGTGLYLGTPGTGVTAYESGDAKHHTTKLTFTDQTIGAAVGAANLAFGKLLYTLPAGAVVIKAATMSVAATGSGSTCDADTPDGGLGTVIGSGANALLSATGTFEDILTGQTYDDVNGTAEVKTVSNQVLTIEASAAHTVHFNLADGWAGACTVTGTGTVVIEWVLLI